MRGVCRKACRFDSCPEHQPSLAAKLAAHAPLAMEAMKRILNSVECGQLDRASAARAIENCLVSDDHREALAAWNEKRAPLFRGK